MPSFELTLPAVRGKQAGRDFYLVMCPLQVLSRLFREEDDTDRSALLTRHAVNAGRVPEIARYIADHPDSYVIPSITGAIDREVEFEPVSRKGTGPCLGTLKVPLSARLVIHDGLHRRLAIEIALKHNPELADETVPVVLYVDPGLGRSDQIFSDLKRHETRAPRSQSILYDNRDEVAIVAKELTQKVDAFQGMTETTRSKISNRSLKLFTLSGIYHATGALLAPRNKAPLIEKLDLATGFWTEVARNIPDWKLAKDRKISPAELRRTRIHAHAIALAALARVGRTLIESGTTQWRGKLSALKSLDWSRANTRLWEGRAMIAGRLSKSNTSVMLTGNAIKQHLGLVLSADEQEAEDRLRSRGA